MSDPDYYWFERELARYRYKPGWDLRLSGLYNASTGYGSRFNLSPTMVVTARLPDSREGRHDELVKVASMAPIPELIRDDGGAFADWLRSVLHRREAHEADEWLRRDGVVLFDPHAKERNV